MPGFIAMRDDLLDLVAGVRFLIRLPGLLTLDIDPAEPLAKLRVRFENREPKFLERVYDVAYASPQAPYGKLFAWAGCQYEDVVSMVQKEGIEGTLQMLFRTGIYLSFEELRGTKPVRRGNLTLNVRPEHLVNPRVAAGMLLQRAARDRVTGIRVNREAFRGYALPLAAYEIIRGSMDTARGSWNEVSSTWLQRQVAGAVLGYPSERWFSQLDPSTPELPWRLRWAARWLHWSARTMGKRVPLPEYVPLDEPEPILRWVEQSLRGGKSPLLTTQPSAAVRLAEAAQKSGKRLDGLSLLPFALMSNVWREGAFVRVERRAPITSQSGKIAHLLAAGHQRSSEPS